MYRTYTQKAIKHWYFQKIQIANYSSYYPRKTNFPPMELHAAAAAAKSLQSWPTLCDPIDGSPPGSPLGFSRQEYWSGVPLLSPAPMQLFLFDATHRFKFTQFPQYIFPVASISHTQVYYLLINSVISLLKQPHWQLDKWQNIGKVHDLVRQIFILRLQHYQ